MYVAILFAISVPADDDRRGVCGHGLRRGEVEPDQDARLRSVVSARVNQEMMGKIVERFGMMTLIKIRDQKRVESKRIEDFSETMRDISVKQARLGANIEVTADPVLMLSVFVTLYIGIAVLGMTLAQLGLLLFVLNRLNAKVKEFNHGRKAISHERGRVALGQGDHGRRRGFEHDPIGAGDLRGAQAGDRSDRRRVRVPGPSLPGRHDPVQGQVGAARRVRDDPRRLVHGDRGPFGRRQVDARRAPAASARRQRRHHHVRRGRRQGVRTWARFARGSAI